MTFREIKNNIGIDTQLEQAYQRVSQQRRHHPYASDIWHTRFSWSRIKAWVKTHIQNGSYPFEPARERRVKGQPIRCFDSLDAIVMQVVKQQIGPVCERQTRSCCVHIAGRGGLKRALRVLATCAHKYTYVIKSDVYSFYDSIDQTLLRSMLSKIGVKGVMLALCKGIIGHLLITKNGEMT